MQIKLTLLIFTSLMLILSKSVIGQYKVETDKFTYNFDSNTGNINKKDKETNAVISKIITNLNNKKEKESFYDMANDMSLHLLNDKIVMIYDVWNKLKNTNVCYLRYLDIDNDELSTPKELHATEISTRFHLDQINYTTFYSPDNSKVAILRENSNVYYECKPTFLIFKTSTFELISELEMDNNFDGEKRIIDTKGLTLDNEGNVHFAFNTINLETKIPIKTYTAFAPFQGDELTDIEEMTEESGFTNLNSAQGRFYKSIADLANDEPIPGIKVRNQSHLWDTFSGSTFEIIDDAGEVSKMRVKNLPSKIFTYKRYDSEDPFIIRVFDDKPYIVLQAGALMFYSLLSDQGKLFYAHGLDGKLTYFKSREIAEILARFDLDEEYLSEEPKREFNDSVDDYFNKVVQWNIKFISLYNKELGE